MDQQIFSDGVGQITVMGGTVRLDFVTYSPTEKDPGGQPLAVFAQRVVMTADAFLQSAGKIQEAINAMSRLTRQPQPIQPGDASLDIREPSVGPPTEPPPAAAKRPFP